MFPPRVFLTLALAAVSLEAQQAPAPCLQKSAAERPYPKDRLLAMVKDQTPARAEYLIRQCGVSIPWSDGLGAELKAANANDKVVQAVHEVAPKGTTPVVPPTKPVDVKLPPSGPKPGELKINSKDGLLYSFVPAGSFEMGCREGEALTVCEPDAMPVHRVRITKGFWLGQTEATVAAYKRYVRAASIKMPAEPRIGAKSFNPGWASDEFPMVMASWHDAEAYCRWAGMRLPTEAEWEYAARGPGAGNSPSDLKSAAWFADNSGQAAIDSQALWNTQPREFIGRLLDNGNSPHPVAQKQANGWKLYDMLGNASEWTDDFYQEHAYSALPADDPKADSGLHHVVRGGSFLNFPAYVRPWKRQKVTPEQHISTNGFRCAGGSIK